MNVNASRVVHMLHETVTAKCGVSLKANSKREQFVQLVLVYLNKSHYACKLKFVTRGVIKGKPVGVVRPRRLPRSGYVTRTGR
jgi:hypothetical protein